MGRRAADRVKQYHLMSVAIDSTPAPDANGDISLPSTTTSIVLSTIITDPDNQTPYTTAWKQTYAGTGAAFSTPDAASSAFGPLLPGRTYHISVVVTNHQGQVARKSARILVNP